MNAKSDRISKRRLRRLLGRKSSMIGLASVCAVAMPNIAMAQFVTNGGAVPVATGVNASAGGSGAAATGNYAVAVGAGATAANAGALGPNGELNQGNIAIGSGAFAGPAAGGTTLALGTNARAATPLGIGDAMAIGTSAVSSGVDSTAIGGETTASGRQSIAIGNNGTTAAALDSTVIGVNSTAAVTATQSIVLGNNSSSAVANQTILGVGASGTIAAIGGVALGQGSVANRAGLANGLEAFSLTLVPSTQGAVSVGAAGAERQIINVAGGTLNTDAVNVRQLRAVGNLLAASIGGGAQFDATTNAYVVPSFTVRGSTYTNLGAALNALGSGGTGVFSSDNTALALGPISTGANSSAGGYGSVAAGAGATAVGNGSTAAGAGSTVIGNGATDNASLNAVALGSNTSVTGINGIAIGRGATATAAYAIAQGFGATAGAGGLTATNLPTGGIAIGNGAVAGPDLAGSTLAIGNYASATAPVLTNTGDSVAIGTQTVANAVDSIAIGAQTTASAQNTIAIGNNGTTNAGANSVVIGVASTAAAAASGSVVLGSNSTASAANETVLGRNASSTAAGGVALGNGSVQTRAGLAGATEAFSQTAVASTNGSVSIGSAGNERQITNVAGGTQATDAVNVRQLRAVGTNVATSFGSGAAFDATTGAYTAPAYTVGGQTYNNVGAALAAGTALSVQYTPNAAGGPTSAIDLTKGGTLAPVAMTGLANATTATGAVTLGQTPLQYSTSAAPTTANPAVPSNDTTLVGLNAAAPVSLHNLAAGALNANSTDAVNGSQLFGVSNNVAALGTTTAAAIGGGAAYVPGTGITGPNYTLNGAATPFTNVVAGQQALASGAAGPVQYAVPGTPSNALNLVGTGAPVTLGNVAAGALTATSTDAVNGSQLYTTNQTIAGLANGTTGLVQQNPTTRAITVGAGTDGTTVGFANNLNAARTLTGVAAGTVAANSTQAVNGGQLFGTAQSVAARLGGGAAVNADGTVSAPAYTVGGQTYGNVGAALAAGSALSVQYTPDATGAATNVIDLTKGGTLAPVTMTGLANATTATGAVTLGQTPLQYSTIAAPTTANPAVPSNDVTLVGANAGAPVALHNLAAGTLAAGSTDAVNGGQLYTTNQNIAALTNGTAGLVQQAGPNTAITVGAATGGASVGFANNTGAARTLTGVAGGTVAAGSTEAINGSQLAGTAGSVASALGGGSTVNPDGTISAPTYNVANGSYNNVGAALTALDNGISSGRLGAFVSNNSSNRAAPLATGADASAGGFGASATGANSTVLGGNATDNGAANATILGSNGSVTQAGGVALGFGSTATRAALAGANEAFSGTSVGSTQAAVSVGAVGAERQITNVAGGTQDTDAVNLRQLRAVGTNVANSLGGGAGFDATTGAYTAPTYTVGGQAYTNVGAALAAGNALSVQYTPNGAGGATNAIDLTKGGALAPVTMSGLAAGALTATSTDAVNGSQLFATNQQLAAIAGGTSGLVQQDPVSRGITVGAATDGTTVGFSNNAGAARTLTGVAAGQVAAGSTQAVNGGQLAGTAGSVATALGGGAAVNPDGTVSAPTYAVGGTTYNNVGGAITALDSSGVKYDTAPGGGRGQSITLAGGDPNQPVVIHNVAAGTARTDAANFGQVQDAEARANQYTNQRVAGLENEMGGISDRLSGLQSDIQETKREARQGAAIGLAAASLRYDDRPGKISVAAGAGYWRGEAAGAFGLGYTLPDGRFRLNGTVATTGSAVGAGAGATYTFN